MEMDILKTLYDNLDFQLVKSKKRKAESVCFDFLKIKSNDRLNLINESADDLSGIETFEIQKMLVGGLIKENEFGKYYILPRGIWLVESQNLDLKEKLLDFLEIEYFTNKSAGKGLTDKEKVILISLIAMRSFDEDTALDLKKNKLIKDTCAEVLDTINEKLIDLGVVKRTKNFYGTSGNEHKVSHVIRHTDAIPKKIKMIYKNGLNKEQKYFLNLGENRIVNEADLKYIVGKVFEGKHIDYMEIKGLGRILNDLAYSKGPNIYSDMSKSYVQPKYDVSISRCVEEAIMDI